MLRNAYRLACCVNSRAPSQNPLDRIHGARLSCPCQTTSGFSVLGRHLTIPHPRRIGRVAEHLKRLLSQLTVLSFGLSS